MSIREFDATGVQQSLTAPQAVEDVLDQEAALNIDINGDGVIHAIRHIEQDGNAALKIVNGVYTIESPGGDLVMRRVNGSEYAESSRYEFTAVEPKADGEGYVAILRLDDGRVSIREFDATGIQQSLTAPRAVEEVLDQEAALNIDINGDGKIGVNVESEPEFTQLRLELPLGDGWALGSNRISFDLIFPSVATLDDVSLQDGGALFISASSSSVGGVTTTRYSISASNGSADGTLELFFTVGNEDIDDLSAHIEALQVNGVSLGNTSFVSDGVSLFKYVPESAFTIVQETSEIDTIGYDTYYDNIFDALLALPNAQVGVIDSSTPTQAYINIEEGESFLFDHDAFELRAGESNNYRIKIIPENPSFFQSNIIAYAYNADGSRADSIMNLIGNSSAFIDGALYSDVFSMTADERKYLGLSMRWQGEAGEKADGPAPYQIELIAVDKPSFEFIQEIPEIDTVGYGTNYKNIANDLFTLPNAKAGIIEYMNPTQAYLHIEEGESFIFDYDTFELRTGDSGDYRIKITPEDSSLFQSNIIARTYNADGSRPDGIMNLIGNSDSFIDGALYSDVFSMTADERKYLGLSMRWRGDAGEKADGPAPYQVELELIGKIENSYEDVFI